MIFGKERPTDLKGVFSEAAVLWFQLPSKCDNKLHFNCGHIDVVLPGPLLELFKVETDPEAERRLNLFVYSQYDDHSRGRARIFADLGESRVVFQVTSTVNGNSHGRRVVVQRNLIDGTKDTIQVEDEKRDGFVLKALYELAGLQESKMRGNKDLLCGGCSAKVYGLPRPKV